MDMSSDQPFLKTLSRLQMDRNRSLTCGDGPHFALEPLAGLVGCVDVAVVVGGGLQVFHHRGEFGVGQVEHLPGGLRNHQQLVVLRRGHFSPLKHDWSTGQRHANYYLRCSGNWDERAGERASFRMPNGCVGSVRNGAFLRVKTHG